MEVKQVIVIRRDLGMRRGKESAQASHASMAFLLEKIQQVEVVYPDLNIFQVLRFSEAEHVWATGLKTKVVLQASDLAELLEVERLCKEAGLQVHLITDVGLTEFKEPTVTALGIGPAESGRIDAVTGRDGSHPLKLY